MIHVEVEPRHEQVTSFLRAVYSDQLPFATSRAINFTALDVQKRQRQHHETIFEIRRPQFVQNAVKIKPFARKNSLQARVLIEPPGGQKRADILTKFETQTQKLPFRGSRLVVPTENVPRSGGVIARKWRPRNLNLQPQGGGRVFSRKGNVLVGRHRTFAILKPGGRGAIFERDGDDVIPLYWIVPHVRIRPNLRFVANATQVVRSKWEPNFLRAFDDAMRTARSPGPSFVGLARIARAI